MGIIIVAIILVAIYGIYTFVDSTKKNQPANNVSSSAISNDVSSTVDEKVDSNNNEETSSVMEVSSEEVSSIEEENVSSNIPVSSNIVSSKNDTSSTKPANTKPEESELFKLLKSGNYNDYTVWVSCLSAYDFTIDVNKYTPNKYYVNAISFDSNGQITAGCIRFNGTDEQGIEWEQFYFNYSFDSTTNTLNVEGLGKLTVRQAENSFIPLFNANDGSIESYYETKTIQFTSMKIENNNFIVDTDYCLEEIHD